MALYRVWTLNRGVVNPPEKLPGPPDTLLAAKERVLAAQRRQELESARAEERKRP